MTVDCPSMSMIIHLASTSANGTLTISLPRSLLDVKTQTGDDKDFVILVNGMEVNYLEMEKNQDARTLSIPFSADAMEIEIIGMDVGQNLPVVPHFCGIGGTNESLYYHLLSPLEQFKRGVEAKDVKCKEGLQFIMKNENGHPACVTPSTAQKLVERGWAMAVATYTQQNIPTLSNSITVPNTNFTINYNFGGNGKILGANMDAQSKALILSLETKSSGTLTISLPRALLDIKKNDRGMGGFLMLADGQETAFKEIHTTSTDRIFSIPFQNGTKDIEIVATELI